MASGSMRPVSDSTFGNPSTSDPPYSVNELTTTEHVPRALSHPAISRPSVVPPKTSTSGLPEPSNPHPFPAFRRTFLLYATMLHRRERSCGIRPNRLTANVQLTAERTPRLPETLFLHLHGQGERYATNAAHVQKSHNGIGGRTDEDFDCVGLRCNPYLKVARVLRHHNLHEQVDHSHDDGQTQHERDEHRDGYESRARANAPRRPVRK